MTIPNSFTFVAANGQYLTWFLNDVLTGIPITDATMLATLYAGRDRDDPDATPGTPVAGFTGISLAYVDNEIVNGQTYGTYRGVIPSTFDPDPGGDYVLIVDATSGGYQPQHWESPAIVRPRGS